MTNFYRFKAMQEKMLHEGMEIAEARMQIQAEKRKYCGNNLVAKYQKHDGTYVYQMTEEVVQEMLKYIIVISQAAETVYTWETLKKKAQDVTPRQQAIMHFLSTVQPDKKYLDSLVKCYQGSPMLSFYRDAAAREEQEKYEAERQKVQDMWGY